MRSCSSSMRRSPWRSRQRRPRSSGTRRCSTGPQTDTWSRTAPGLFRRPIAPPPCSLSRHAWWGHDVYLYHSTGSTRTVSGIWHVTLHILVEQQLMRLAAPQWGCRRETTCRHQVQAVAGRTCASYRVSGASTWPPEPRDAWRLHMAWHGFCLL